VVRISNAPDGKDHDHHSRFEIDVSLGALGPKRLMCQCGAEASQDISLELTLLRDGDDATDRRRSWSRKIPLPLSGEQDSGTVLTEALTELSNLNRGLCLDPGR